MSDWKVTHKTDATLRNALTHVLTCGLTAAAGYSNSVYTIENTETGEVRKVVTEDNFTLGQRIADGEI